MQCKFIVSCIAIYVIHTVSNPNAMMANSSVLFYLFPLVLPRQPPRPAFLPHHNHYQLFSTKPSFFPPILLSCFAAHTRMLLKNSFRNDLSPLSFLPFSLSLPLPSCFAARVKKFIIQTCSFVYSSVGLFCYGRRRDRLGTLNRAHPTYYIQKQFQPQMLLKLLGE